MFDSLAQGGILLLRLREGEIQVRSAAFRNGCQLSGLGQISLELLAVGLKALILRLNMRGIGFQAFAFLDRLFESACCRAVSARASSRACSHEWRFSRSVAGGDPTGGGSSAG